MQEYGNQPEQAARQDAIDINDFVYAATGAHVRRLRTADGQYWFPAADVCRELGYANTSDALRQHVPQSMRCVVATLVSREGREIPAGHKLKKSMVLLSLNGLVRLVNGCVKRECEPFKNWVTEVVVTVQREGSYSLQRAEVQPAEADGPTAYAMPREVADAIVRLEERNMRLDEESLESRRAELALSRELVDAVQRAELSVPRELVDAMGQRSARAEEWQRGMPATQRDLAGSMARVADALERTTAHLREREAPGESGERPAPAGAPRPTADEVLAAWRARLTITDDVWAVAVSRLPELVGQPEAAVSPEALATRAGLTVGRVRDCLRFLQKRHCIRQVHATSDGAPVYVLQHP